MIDDAAAHSLAVDIQLSRRTGGRFDDSGSPSRRTCHLCALRARVGGPQAHRAHSLASPPARPVALCQLEAHSKMVPTCLVAAPAAVLISAAAADLPWLSSRAKPNTSLLYMAHTRRCRRTLWTLPQNEALHKKHFRRPASGTGATFDCGRPVRLLVAAPLGRRARGTAPPSAAAPHVPRPRPGVRLAPA